MSGFGQAKTFEYMTATFSPCRTWRYSLHRSCSLLKAEPRLLAVIGLNPSTADETSDDPTVRRCIRYAFEWGYQGLCMLNLFAFRATDPADMKAARDPVGPGNNKVLRSESEGRDVLCAWGVHGKFWSRGSKVRWLLRDRNLLCLGRTADGEPKHPLYMRADLKPEPLT